MAPTKRSAAVKPSNKRTTAATSRASLSQVDDDDDPKVSPFMKLFLSNLFSDLRQDFKNSVDHLNDSINDVNDALNAWDDTINNMSKRLEAMETDVSALSQTTSNAVALASNANNKLKDVIDGTTKTQQQQQCSSDATTSFDASIEAQARKCPEKNDCSSFLVKDTKLTTFCTLADALTLASDQLSDPRAFY